MLSGPKIDPCQRQAFVSTCTNPDGTMTRSQFVLRYYKRDYECVSYPYGHCRKNPEEPELYKYKDECEKNCLGVPSSVNAGPLVPASNATAASALADTTVLSGITDGVNDSLSSRSLEPVWQRPSVTQSTSTSGLGSVTTAAILAPVDQRLQPAAGAASTPITVQQGSTVAPATGSSSIVPPAAAVPSTVQPGVTPGPATVPPPAAAQPPAVQPPATARPTASATASSSGSSNTPDIFDVTDRDFEDAGSGNDGSATTASSVVGDLAPTTSTRAPVAAPPSAAPPNISPPRPFPPVSASPAAAATVGPASEITSTTVVATPAAAGVTTIPPAAPARSENEDAGSSFLDLLPSTSSKRFLVIVTYA